MTAPDRMETALHHILHEIWMLDTGDWGNGGDRQIKAGAAHLKASGLVWTEDVMDELGELIYPTADLHEQLRTKLNALTDPSDGGGG